MSIFQQVEEYLKKVLNNIRSRRLVEQEYFDTNIAAVESYMDSVDAAINLAILAGSRGDFEEMNKWNAEASELNNKCKVIIDHLKTL